LSPSHDVYPTSGQTPDPQEFIMDTVQLLLDDAVSEDLDGRAITFSYLSEGGPTLDSRTMKRDPRKWMEEYLRVVRSRKVRWQTSREIDPTGGDLVRIWTEDLAGSFLEDDCDFLVWASPDETVGEDFVKFLSRT
jgi:hypothetical protein